MRAYFSKKMQRRFVAFLLVSVVVTILTSCGNDYTVKTVETTEHILSVEAADTTVETEVTETESAPIIARDMASIINISAEDLAVKTPAAVDNDNTERCDKPKITI